MEADLNQVKSKKSRGEPQYQTGIDVIRKRGIERLGVVTSWAWHDDPRHLLFTMSRYKFVAKMLAGRNCVLEIGCADGFPTRIVAQAVGSVVAVDFDEELITNARERPLDRWPIDFRIHNILHAPLKGTFDAAFALDVIEHIPLRREDQFIENIRRSLTDTGILVIGTPSLESQQFASRQSRQGHVNCKSADDLKATLEKHFSNVFIFSMNDEVIHTGYHKLAHYLMALCCAPKSRARDDR
jgi:2-polyprenyl-3-methyl-5-hydroxy-6-metoxy-1,4-benzoquinol methylase